jgi:F0F1-type ATP synthase delta subunit
MFILQMAENHSENIVPEIAKHFGSLKRGKINISQVFTHLI